MNKTLKYGLISAGAVLAAFVALIALVAATFNPNDYKPLIVKLVQEKKQRTLKLDGDIRLTFFPRIGADFGRLSLTEQKSDKEFAAADSARVSLALLPLLKKQLVVNRIKIDGLRASLVRHPDGSTNFDDFLKKEEQKLFRFDLEGVSITRAALSLDDQMTGRHLAIKGLEAESGRLASGEPGRIALKFTLLGDNPKINAQVALASDLVFDTKARRLALKGLNSDIEGEAAGIAHLASNLKGSFDLDGATGAVTLDGLAFSLIGKRGADGLDIRLVSPKFELGPERALGKIDLVAQLMQPKGNLDLVLSVPALEGKGSAFHAESLVLEVNGKQGDSTIRSRFTSPLNADLETRQFSLEKLAANLSVSGPAMAKALSANLGGAARLDLVRQDGRLDLSGKLDGSRLKARLGMTGFGAPAYDFDVAIDRLDLDRYLPAKPEEKTKQPELPPDFSFLRKLNASGSLRIGELKLSDIESRNVRLEVKAQPGGRE